MADNASTNATGLPSREQVVEAAKRAADMSPVSEPPVAQPVSPAPEVSIKQSFFNRLMTIVQFRKQQRKERMVMLAEELKSITSEDVRRRIRIIKVTARKYLEELVHEGRLQRHGKKGSYVYEIASPELDGEGRRN